MPQLPIDEHLKAIRKGIALSPATEGLPLLSEYSLDQLWDLYDRIQLITRADLEMAETIQRLIRLRSTEDGWVLHDLKSFFKVADFTITADDTTTVSLTNGTYPRALVILSVTDDALFAIDLDLPANYEYRFLDGGVWTDDEITITITAFGDGTGLKHIIASSDFFTEALNNGQKTVRSELTSVVPHCHLRGGNRVRVASNEALLDTKLVVWHQNVLVKRVPTWIART